MICRNCGWQNPPDFAYCGSCGHALEPDATQPGSDDSSDLEETTITPPGREVPLAVQPLPARRSWSQAVPVEPTQREARGRRPTAVVCRNCGRANNPNRSVCFQCGRRLVVPAAVRAQRARDDDGAGARTMALAASALVVVLAISAAGLLVGGILLGGGPGATATPLAMTSPAGGSPSEGPIVPATATPTSPRPTVTPPTAPPAQPTVHATAAPTEAPATPAQTPLNCNGSPVETGWLNMTRGDARHRLGGETAWCVHTVVITPYFGNGTIRLLIDGEPAAQVRHAAGAAEDQYSFDFEDPLLVLPRSTLRYAFACNAADCAAIIQVGYDAMAAP